MQVRRLAGIGALVLFIVALNAMVWAKSATSLPMAGLLVLALVCGLVWCVLVILDARSRSALQGRAVSSVNAVVSSLLFLGICVVLFAFVSSWKLSLDLTKEGRRKLAPQTIQVLRTMNKEVEVICFFLRVDDELVLIARDKTLRFLRQCQQYTDLLKVELADPQIDIPRLKAMGLNAVSPQGTIVIQSGGRHREISLSGGSPRLEEWDFTNALVNVLRSSEPKVAFLMGHSERDVTDEDPNIGGSMLANALTNESYQVGKLEIRLNDPELPQDIDVLVINNPDGDLHPVELQAIDGFIDRGGQLFVMLDPWLNVRMGSSQREHLRPWLERRFGIQVGGDVVVREGDKDVWRIELRNDNKPFEDIDEGFMEFRGSFHADNPITRGFDQAMLLQAARSVQAMAEAPDGVALTPLLRSTPEYWTEYDVARVKERQPVHRDGEEREGPIPLAVAATLPAKHAEGDARKEARIVVVGDSDFASNGGLQMSGHLNFALDVFAWLSSAEDLIAIRPTTKEDLEIILTETEQRAVVWISTLLTVQVVLAAGIGAAYARRKHR